MKIIYSEENPELLQDFINSLSFDSNKLYNFYVDEGGMFGSCYISINKQKLHKVNNEVHISNYLYGKLTLPSICTYLKRFNYVFPNTNIFMSELSDIK